MKITRGETFTKSLAKLNNKQQLQVNHRLNLWVKNPTSRQLHDHPLHSRWEGYRGINISGDLRLIYRYVSRDEIFVVTVGGHSQLFG